MKKEKVYNSSSVYNSSYVDNSSSVDNSCSVYNSSYVDNSSSVDNSRYVDNSRSVRFLYKAIFCFDIGFKEYVVFNKEVGKKRFEELYSNITKIVSPNLKMKDEAFSEEWEKNVSKEQWIELSKIPEFDRKVVENIVGFTLPIDEIVEEIPELTMEEVCKQLGKTIKIKK